MCACAVRAFVCIGAVRGLCQISTSSVSGARRWKTLGQLCASARACDSVFAPHPAAPRIAFDPAAHASLNGQHGTWESRMGRGMSRAAAMGHSRAAGACEPKRATDGARAGRAVPSEYVAFQAMRVITRMRWLVRSTTPHGLKVHRYEKREVWGTTRFCRDGHSL